MKDKYTVAERNRIVEEQIDCIDKVLYRHRHLLLAARLEYEDLYQDLAIRLILAVDSYHTEVGPLRTYLMGQLEQELTSSQEIQQLLKGENISWQLA